MSQLTAAYRLGFGRAALAADAEIEHVRQQLSAALSIIEIAVDDGRHHA